MRRDRIPCRQPTIDVGLQEQRFVLVVLFDGGDLGEKLLLDVLREAVCKRAAIVAVEGGIKAAHDDREI